MSVSPATGRLGTHGGHEQDSRGDSSPLLDTLAGHSSSTCSHGLPRPGRHSLYPAAVHFIINHCLADKGRVQVKNIQNFQTEGLCRPAWTPSHSQQTINIPVAAELAATQSSLPCRLRKHSQDFLPRKPAQATRRGKNRRCTHSLLSTLVGLCLTSILSILGF